MIEKTILYDYFENNLTRNLIMAKYNITKNRFVSITNRFVPTLSFDVDLFHHKLRDDLENMLTNDFATKYKVNFQIIRQLKSDPYRLTIKKAIVWFKMLNIPYKLEIDKVKRFDSASTIIVTLYEKIEKPIRRTNAYMMTHEEKKDYNEKMMLLDNQRRKLIEKLYAKGLAATTISSIIDSMNVIAREALLIGVIAQKNGYGSKVEYAIARKVEQE